MWAHTSTYLTPSNTSHGRVSSCAAIASPPGCMQSFANGRGYTLSKTKRSNLFPELTDTEVAALEEAIRSAFAVS